MREPRVVIIGAGFGGLGLAARLRQAGYRDLVVLDQADDVGGTWRDNTYPGAACDVPSHLYSFSFAPGRWRHRYGTQPEILAYLRGLVRRHRLAPFLRLGTAVRAVTWDDETDGWRLALDDGQVLGADAVVSAVGQLNRPFVPELDGLADFRGEWWHSARWRHDVELAGRRVAVLGTGASAIQFVPHLAEAADHVTVFQRSAPYVLPRSDRRYGPARQHLARVPVARQALRAATYARLELVTHAFTRSRRLAASLEQQWRSHLRAQVPDPELRARLVPDYSMGCKRVLISDDWYPTLGRADVTLVPQAAARVAPDGVVAAGGSHHPCDVLVFGTGFRTLEFLVPMTVTGREGRDLHEAWHAGAEAYRGTTVAGFPNLFLLYGPNTNLGSNSILYMLESQFRYVRAQLDALARHGLAWADVTERAQERFNRQLQNDSARTAFTADCHSWYTTADGRNTNNWPDYTFRFRRLTRTVDLADHVVMPRRDVARPAVGMPAR